MSNTKLINDGIKTFLEVDGHPFFILGIQIDCDSSFTLRDLKICFENAKKMCCNSIALPVYWKEVEPEKDVYNHDLMEERICLAEEFDLKSFSCGLEHRKMHL